MAKDGDVSLQLLTEGSLLSLESDKEIQAELVEMGNLS